MTLTVLSRPKDSENVMALAETGADIKSQRRDGQTALNLAFEHKSPDSVRELLRNVAEIDNL